MTSTCLLIILSLNFSLSVLCYASKMNDLRDLYMSGGMQESAHEIWQIFLQTQDMKSDEEDAREEAAGFVNVQTTSGLLTGVTLDESHAFYGIPFAQPPIHDLRFQPPQLYNAPSEQVDGTTQTKNACQQFKVKCLNETILDKFNRTEDMNCTYDVEEDCLYLNIFVPNSMDLTNSNSPPTGQIPVMVYAHGGSFLTGSANSKKINGRFLSQMSNTIIVVTNYRLGPFGFLAFDDGQNIISGKQGIQDQQMALKWVSDNIAKFGGDPSSVTLFGESAGAQSVMFHLLSNESEPYFHRAIMESNPAVFPYPTPEESHVVTKRLTDFMKCPEGSEYECLMGASASEIYNPEYLIRLEGFLSQSPADVYAVVEPYRPVIDGDEFKCQPLECFRDGQWLTHIPFYIGTNSEELSIIEYFIPFPTPFPVYQFVNKLLFGEEIGRKITERYDNEYGKPVHVMYADIFSLEMTHFFFTCPTRRLARFASTTRTSAQGVYLYSNNYGPQGDSCVEYDDNPQFCGKSYHGSELIFVFRSGPSVGYPFTQNDLSVANQFTRYWVDFAYSGALSSGVNSSIGSFTDWPMYTEQNQWKNLLIDSPESSEANSYLDDLCNFWDELGVYIDMSDDGNTTTTYPTTNLKTTTTTLNEGTDTTTDGGGRITANAFVLSLLSMLLACQVM